MSNIPEDESYRGERGPTGDRGDIGNEGHRGRVGDEGPKGNAGERGERGTVGYAAYVSGIIIAVVVSIVITLYIQRDSLIQGCKRSGPRAALSAKFANDAADQRFSDGLRFPKGSKSRDKLMTKSGEYRATAQGQIATIAAPKGHEGDPALAKVMLNTNGARPKYILTVTSEKLQSEGCDQAYPPIIPHVK